jgi:hypothetical protein
MHSHRPLADTGSSPDAVTQISPGLLYALAAHARVAAGEGHPLNSLRQVTLHANGSLTCCAAAMYSPWPARLSEFAFAVSDGAVSTAAWQTSSGRVLVTTDRNDLQVSIVRVAGQGSRAR